MMMLMLPPRSLRVLIFTLLISRAEPFSPYSPLAFFPPPAGVRAGPSTTTTTATTFGQRRGRIATARMTVVANGLPPRNPGESKDEYFDRITRAAADPAEFARMVLPPQDYDDDETVVTSLALEIQQQEDSSNNAKTTTTSTTTVTTTTTTRRRRGYVRAEEWDAEQQEQMTVAERLLQHEAQIHGNRLRQNEILRHHLNGF
jgi:hypothetical protein